VEWFAAVSLVRYSLNMEILVQAPSAVQLTSGANSIEHRIANRLAELRAERGWTLETLAQRTGISRATLSRLERYELSPSAAMLATLCGQYGWTLSRLMVEAEQTTPSVISAEEQVTWRDPDTGYIRRVVSAPHPKLRGELIEVILPAGASVSYDASYLPGFEHHLWLMEGRLSIELGGTLLRLQKGDCARFVLSGSTKFACGRHLARYVIALVHP
jgi:transcriptional regulator with XRE-family HTH domain